MDCQSRFAAGFSKACGGASPPVNGRCRIPRFGRNAGRPRRSGLAARRAGFRQHGRLSSGHRLPHQNRSGFRSAVNRFGGRDEDAPGARAVLLHHGIAYTLGSVDGRGQHIRERDAETEQPGRADGGASFGEVGQFRFRAWLKPDHTALSVKTSPRIGCRPVRKSPRLDHSMSATPAKGSEYVRGGGGAWPRRRGSVLSSPSSAAPRLVDLGHIKHATVKKLQ